MSSSLLLIASNSSGNVSKIKPIFAHPVAFTSVSLSDYPCRVSALGLKGVQRAVLDHVCERVPVEDAVKRTHALSIDDCSYNPRSWSLVFSDRGRLYRRRTSAEKGSRARLEWRRNLFPPQIRPDLRACAPLWAPVCTLAIRRALLRFRRALLMASVHDGKSAPRKRLTIANSKKNLSREPSFVGTPRPLTIY
jgi:hypothetical protein